MILCLPTESIASSYIQKLQKAVFSYNTLGVYCALHWTDLSDQVRTTITKFQVHICQAGPELSLWFPTTLLYSDSPLHYCTVIPHYITVQWFPTTLLYSCPWMTPVKCLRVNIQIKNSCRREGCCFSDLHPQEMDMTIIRWPTRVKSFGNPKPLCSLFFQILKYTKIYINFNLLGNKNTF